jgi:Fe-S cluster assembly iron-binding protein IscA
MSMRRRRHRRETKDLRPGRRLRRHPGRWSSSLPRRVKAIVASAGLIESWALRLEASWPEGVCGPQHQMRFDAAPPSSEDHAFESAGIKLVVLKRQVDLLRGTEINFGEKSGEQGFIINTPNFQGESLEKWGPVLQADPLSAAK